jgi:hypothetical protein
MGEIRAEIQKHATGGENSKLKTKNSKLNTNRISKNSRDKPFGEVLVFGGGLRAILTA